MSEQTRQEASLGVTARRLFAEVITFSCQRCGSKETRPQPKSRGSYKHCRHCQRDLANARWRKYWRKRVNVKTPRVFP